ncbi:MAG: ATP synthase F1 subunit delta [Leptospiraceae bacterium]|nr:ATP synthase F1 subunit delta [Leptospiraceae bacterium]MCB1319276.1 ATP synthase F1 subunit delta [Leptospiraceae bacterium]
MQQDGKIASVYTEAYVELWENARLDEAAEELKQVVSAVQSDELVWRFFQSPVLSPEDKINVLNSVIKPVVSETLYNFLGTLIKRRRFEYLPEIEQHFLRLVDDRLERRHVIVESAVALDDAQQEQLTKTLTERLKRSVVLVARVRPELIGGFLLRSEDLLIDTTLRNRLRRMRNQMTQRKIAGEAYYEN